MSFLFSVMFMPVIVIGLAMSTKDIYQYLSKHPALSRGKAGAIAFSFAGISAGLLAVPHVFTAASGAFTYLVAAVTALFIIVGLRHIWNWARLIWIVEDGDPSNDPFPKNGDCGCPKKGGTANGDATKGDTKTK